VAPRVHILLVDMCYQSSGNAIYAYQVVTPGQHLLRSCKGEKRVPDASKLGEPAKGDNRDRKHWPFRIAGGWVWG
jgi:hypothetical protein